MTAWEKWHDDYDTPGSFLSRRLGVVQEMLGRAIDGARPGPVRLLSLCAGQARDVLGVVPTHRRRADVVGRLVELDPSVAAVAGDGLAVAGLTSIKVVVADAGSTSSAAGAVPADVVLLCGIFGNISDADVETTIRTAPMSCAAGATVIWTRHRRPPDLVPRIRAWFDDAGFAEVDYVEVADSVSTVGAHRLTTPPPPFEPGRRMFSFR